MESKERRKNEADQSRLIGGRFHKQGRVYTGMSLMLQESQISTPTRIFILILFIYFSLCWVFLAVQDFLGLCCVGSSVVASLAVGRRLWSVSTSIVVAQ